MRLSETYHEQDKKLLSQINHSRRMIKRLCIALVILAIVIAVAFYYVLPLILKYFG